LQCRRYNMFITECPEFTARLGVGLARQPNNDLVSISISLQLRKLQWRIYK